jgi:SPP1 gp7 family putative phage head morphogenesis protein
MSNRAAVQRILSQTVESLEGIERPALLQISTVLHRAQEEVQRDMSAWLRKHPGAGTFTTQQYRKTLVILDTAIAKAGDMEGTVDHAFKSTAKRLAPLSVANLKREWLDFGRIFEGTVQPLPIDEAIVIARGNKLLWPRFERSAAKYAGEVGDGLRVHLAISRARGETIDDLTNRLYRRMPSVFKGELSSAERLALTETHHTYNTVHHEGIREAHKEDDQICQRWEASEDGRRCPACAALDGQLVSVDGEFEARWTEGKVKHLLRSAYPPLHPRCRCCLVAWRESWASFANPASMATLRRAAEEFRMAA